MNDPTKKLNNPLFSASVTGGTFEDFSQNAILLPAKEKPLPPILKLSHEQIINDIVSNPSERILKYNPGVQINTVQQIPTVTNPNLPETFSQPVTTIAQELPDISSLQPHLISSASQSSHFSSVFSTFSNILNIGSLNNENKKEESVIAPPAGIEGLIGQNNNNPDPVPLFSASTSEFAVQKPPLATGTVNQFRRSGLKRPVYAQIPGLSNVPQQSQPHNYPQNIPPLPVVSETPPQNIPAYCSPPSAPSPTNSLSSTSSIEVTHSLPNSFKPISPPPSHYNLQSNSNSQPFAPIPIQPPSSITPINIPSYHTNFVNSANILSGPVSLSQPVSIDNISKNIFTPVMDAIPVSEISQNSNLSISCANTAPRVVTTPETPSNVAPTVNQVYRPVYHHWFFQKKVDDKNIWQPFSMVDSLALEHVFTSNDVDPEKLIATDGGRFDVNILRRKRMAVYWKTAPTEVRRCSWFHKSSPDGRLIPYEENIATKLEEEYKIAFETNHWHRKIELAEGETIVLHGPDILVLFSPQQVPDAWGNQQNQSRPKIVKRGMDEFDIDEGEPSHVDHILFMVHGIGSVCDLKFRTVEEVVDDFRSIAFQLVQSHYRSSCDTGKVNRVEILPISWHDKLHSEDTGVDEQLKSITLESIPRLRGFTNDTLLDILFYTSPIYCQNIISTVGNELNRIYELFKQRNPTFNGGVSLGGHSLGSLILFDLLCHQDSKPESDTEESDDILTQKPDPKNRRMNKRISYMMGTTGTGQPQIHYPRLDFEPKTFFALGSPIGMFVIVRGLDQLGENFSLPTCPSFFNIFHPYDPIAYRIESLLNPEYGKLKPVLIPHHKGRKRMHLELKETMARVGADLKHKVIDSMRSTWNSFYQLAMFHKQSPPSLEDEVSKAFQDQLREKEYETEPTQEITYSGMGSLNNGRRVDYVLQEAPFEIFNDYIFALTSHVCYWDSEDTVLLMLKEIYSSLGVQSDSQIPQQTMTIERPFPSPTSNVINPQQIGMDPTQPIQLNANIQPPPVLGFVRKS